MFVCVCVVFFKIKLIILRHEISYQNSATSLNCNIDRVTIINMNFVWFDLVPVVGFSFTSFVFGCFSFVKGIFSYEE